MEDGEEPKVVSEKALFADIPVGKAVMSMILPTVISQIILVIYNLADTWYVGLTENAYAVAAVSLCLPVYTILSAISNLFGIGGAGAMARALGINDYGKARRLLRVSLLGALSGAILYAVVMAVFGREILWLIGGAAQTIEDAVTYTLWTIVIGGAPTILSPVCGNLVRAMGKPRAASFGMILGGLLNILLDPLFMFVLLPPGNEVAGAAIATALSNLVGLVYFLIYLHICQQRIFEGKLSNGKKKWLPLLREILQGGIPGFCMVALAMLSNCVLNSMISSLGSEAVAGLGIVRKIDQLAYAVNQGITQGILPLVAYCYSSGRRKRMWTAVGIAGICSECFSMICMVVSLILAPQLITVFICDPVTIHFGAEFLRVLCLAIPAYTLTFLIIAVFQAAGRGAEPFLLSVLHKGSLDIALLFLIRRLAGVEALVWAAPISEVVALAVGFIMILFFWKNQKRSMSLNI